MKKDIFDKIMSLKIFTPIFPLYKKYKEILLYLFFGGLTFLVSVLSYSYFITAWKIDELIANVISWVLAVIFAFITNRIWVFSVNISGLRNIIKQLWDFTVGRVATLLIEEAILYVFITLLHQDSIVVKIIAQIVVIVLNYIISKLYVFK